MKLDHIAIGVNDIEESEKFYVENLEFKRVADFNDVSHNGNVVVLEKDGLRLELVGFQCSDCVDDVNVSRLGVRHFGFVVDNVDQVAEKLKSKGVKVDRVCNGKTCERFCFIFDPNGIVIELVEYQK